MKHRIIHTSKVEEESFQNSDTRLTAEKIVKSSMIRNLKMKYIIEYFEKAL